MMIMIISENTVEAIFRMDAPLASWPWTRAPLANTRLHSPGTSAGAPVLPEELHQLVHQRGLAAAAAQTQRLRRSPTAHA